MSTRAMIAFSDRTPFQGDPFNWIYRHSDGYPNGEHGLVSDLDRFFQAVRHDTEGSMFGTRFTDPCYLAAKYVVWQAGQNAQHDTGQGPLAFGSLGISLEPHGDCEWLYWIQCGAKSRGPGARPVVWVSRAGGERRWKKAEEYRDFRPRNVHPCPNCGKV